MKNLISCLTLCLLATACTTQMRPSPLAGTQPADFSWFCEQKFSKGQPTHKTVAPQELDVRSCDISTWNFSTYSTEELADVLTFDSKTKFPQKDKLPKGFSPAKILKQAQNPGLGVHALHKKGITGQGVSVAILDQNLLLDHEQYADRIRYYWQDPVYQEHGGRSASMHGSAVTSILAGKTVGVAPQADVYYWANNLIVDEQNVLDAGAAAKDLLRLLDYNFRLPEKDQIRVVSISRGFSKWDKDPEKFNQAVSKLANHNIAVFTTNDVFTLSRTHSLSSPDGDDYCRPAYWFDKTDLPHYANISNPLVPTDFRVTAAPNGPQDYVHYANGGLSWAVPYLAGLYALGVQVYPDLTKDLFMQVVRDTADKKECSYQGEKISARYFVNPVALINQLQEMNNAN